MTNKAMLENIQNASKYNNASNGVASVTLNGHIVRNNGTVFGGKKGVIQSWAKAYIDKTKFPYDRTGFDGRVHHAGQLMAPKPYETLKDIGLVTLKRGKFHGCPHGHMNVRIHGQDYTIIIFSAKMDKH